MTQPQFDYVQRGVFYTHSSVSQNIYSISQFEECMNQYTKKMDSIHSGRYGWTPDSSELSVRLSDLNPLLVVGHERFHYAQMMSTPCGLLIWRLLNSITSTIAFICSKIATSSAQNSCYLPLPDWYESIGREAIRNDPPLPSEVLCRKFRMDFDAYRKTMPALIDLKFLELNILNQFLHAFLGKQQLTMKEFVHLSNQAFQILSNRCDLDIKATWDAHDLSAQSYLPEKGFSLREIVEASARIWEHLVLNQYNLRPLEKRIWRMQSIQGVYEPVYNYLISEIGDLLLSLILIDISMIAPVDLCCSKATDGILYVEDVLPGWRMVKMVNSIKDTFWSDSRKFQEKSARSRIAKMSGIPTPEEVIKATLSTRFSGDLGWGGDAKLQGIPEDATTLEYFKYSENEIRRGLQIRLHDSLSFIRPKWAEVFQPAVEFFKDKAFFHGSPTTEYSPLLHVRMFNVLVGNLTVMSLLSNGNVSVLSQLQQSFSTRMEMYEGAKDYDSNWNVKDITSDLLGPVLSNLLEW